MSESERHEATDVGPDVSDTPSEPVVEADVSAGDATAEAMAPEPGPAAPDAGGDDTGDEDATDAVDVTEAAEDPRSKAELLAELRETEARRDEYLDDVRRARAEFENYRKRIMREGATQREHGKVVIVERLLDVLDDVDRTLEAASASDDRNLAQGIEMVASKLVQVLQSNGLERIDATGIPFDPNRHEAVQQQHADEPVDEPTVVRVLRPGYRLGDRVLRAAMVVVEQ